MRKLFFICEWAFLKRKTWSGTCWHIKRALRKYFKIKNIPLSTKFSIFLRKIIKNNNNYTLKANGINNRKLEKIDTDEKIFQFTDVKRGHNTFTYVDLVAPFILELYEKNKEIFYVSGFKNHTYEVLKYRSQDFWDYLDSGGKVLTMSKWLCDWIKQKNDKYIDNVFYIGAGYNCSVIKKELNKSRNKLLYIGRDYIRKDLLLVIESYKSAKEVLPELELFVAGVNPKYLDANYKGNGITYVGECNEKKISKLYKVCDIFIMPSKFEAFGIVFIEALANGLPCIGRNSYEMPNFIENGKTGLLLENEDSEELSEKILQILRSDEYFKNVIARHDYYVKEYSWDTVALRINNIINRKN